MGWDASFALRADPSGRAAGVHNAAYNEKFKADTKVPENGTADEPPPKWYGHDKLTDTL